MPTEEEKRAAEREELWVEIQRLWCHRTGAIKFDLAKFMMLVDEKAGRERVYPLSSFKISS